MNFDHGNTEHYPWLTQRLAGRLIAEGMGLHISRCWIGRFACLACLLVLCAPAWCTTKGLNQIITPDIQPAGQLSISFQDQHRVLGNPQQFQFELGLTKTFEVAIFQGFSPVQTIFNVELGLVERKHFLVSTGFLGPQDGTGYEPFLEGGYCTGKANLIAGMQRQDGANLGLFGASYEAADGLQVMADYISGSRNFATLGVDYELAPELSFNPAVYISNSSHRAFGYGVLTWEIKVW